MILRIETLPVQERNYELLDVLSEIKSRLQEFILLKRTTQARAQIDSAEMTIFDWIEILDIQCGEHRIDYFLTVGYADFLGAGQFDAADVINHVRSENEEAVYCWVIGGRELDGPGDSVLRRDQTRIARTDPVLIFT
jgi:hypothetical protein